MESYLQHMLGRLEILLKEDPSKLSKEYRGFREAGISSLIRELGQETHEDVRRLTEKYNYFPNLLSCPLPGAAYRVLVV